MFYTDHPDMLGGPFYDGRDSLRPNLYKGGKAPKPNKKLELLQQKALKAQIASASAKIKMPEFAVPEPAPPAPPPPSETSADVEEAGLQVRRDALKRRGMAATLLAGNSSATLGGSMTGNRTLLG